MKTSLSNDLLKSTLAVFLLFLTLSTSGAATITQLSGFYHNGQVFLTWENVPDTLVYYKVYRSIIPITSSLQLQSCEYLGYTNFESSRDHNLSHHDKLIDYLSIDSGKTKLSADKGLFVATTLSNGSYYYAVTTLKNNVEETAVLPGANSLVQPIFESVAKPRPAFQQVRIISSQIVEIYTQFTSMKYSGDKLLMNKVGFVAMDFALNRNHSSGNQPLRLKFHPGGADFLSVGTVPFENEMLINPEDYFPCQSTSGFWGANENYDLYDASKNSIPPVTGINYNYTHQRLNLILDWAIAYLPIDSNRIYLTGSSFGSIGAYFYAMTYPERLAAVKLSVGCFNLAFENDSNEVFTLNTGNGNRIQGNNRFGTVSTNLETNLGIPTYYLLNGGWMAGSYSYKNFPVFYSINGKRDTMVGWTEKPMYYDSINTYHLGGYYFYDSRSHGGKGSTWSDDNFDLYRYSRNHSYPAFSNCSANEDYGNGSANSGASFGSVNGFLDWDENIEDMTHSWSVSIFLRDLSTSTGELIHAPTTCTVDITPRRLQQFAPAIGDTILWTVTRNQFIIQSGSFFYTGDPFTIPGVMVFSDVVKVGVVVKTITDTSERSVLSMVIFPNQVVNNANITWTVPYAGKYSMKVYDIDGRWVNTLVEGYEIEGLHNCIWNGDDFSGNPVSSGLYYVLLENGKCATISKCVVTK
ncbi:MAG: hypothetical protein K1X61_13675 [Chitinophagales bacterium]|nr:hypothetical protein [Chitinophagales bacterium]